MDIVTQGLLGGVLAQTVATKDEKRLATLAGVAAGLLADADILIRSANDPLLNIEYHRHFTHSLIFVPIGAFIAMCLLWPFMRQHVSWRRLYVFCLAGFSMSGVLDACTSYGTHLLWPFMDDRIAWNLVAIIDPVFSLILLVALISGLLIRKRSLAAGGLVLSVLYLGLGFVQLQRAQAVTEQLASERGHAIERQIVKPTLGNNILWRSIYIHDNRIYVDAIRVSLLGDVNIFEGENVERLSTSREFPRLDKSSVLYADIQRFKKFSAGYVAYDPTQENVIGDMRYGILPTTTKPLWGIVYDSNKPWQHADYRFFRSNTREVRQRFFNMLFHACATAECS